MSVVIFLPDFDDFLGIFERQESGMDQALSAKCRTPLWDPRIALPLNGILVNRLGGSEATTQFDLAFIQGSRKSATACLGDAHATDCHGGRIGMRAESPYSKKTLVFARACGPRPRFFL
jgi:hypothetical protein